MSSDLDLIAQAASALLQEQALRLAAGLVAAAVLVHFACIAFRCRGATVPLFDAALIAVICAGAAGVLFDAAFMGERDILLAVIFMCGGVISFQLRLWSMGFHVSRFYRERHTP